MGWELWVMGLGLWVNVDVGANGNLPLYKKIYNKKVKKHRKRHLQTNTITQLNADAVIFEHRFRTLLDTVEFYRFI